MRWKTAGAFVLALSAAAAGTAIAAGGEKQIANLDQAQWGPAPPSLPPGAQMAVLSGDPTKRGYFVVLLRGPQGYKIPPHWHTTDEHVTILSGNFTMGMGDSIDSNSGTALTSGGYAMMPRRMHHWAVATSPAVVQIQAMGPFDIHYINPGDDPMRTRKK
jgi:quercetin dioxygenase-like cupin family protein